MCNASILFFVLLYETGFENDLAFATLLLYF